MCRRNQLRGWCLMALGAGLVLGHCVESWLISCCGGGALIIIGFMLLGRK